jgi:hypothetical protein
LPRRDASSTRSAAASSAARRAACFFGSIAIPSLIGVLWWLNGRECLLSSLIYRLAGGDHTRADIFLPDRMARLIMPVSTPLLVLAVALVLWRQMARRWQP